MNQKKVYKWGWHRKQRKTTLTKVQSTLPHKFDDNLLDINITYDSDMIDYNVLVDELLRPDGHRVKIMNTPAAKPEAPKEDDFLRYFDINSNVYNSLNEAINDKSDSQHVELSENQDFTFSSLFEDDVVEEKKIGIF